MNTALPESAHWVAKSRSRGSSPIETGFRFLFRNLGPFLILSSGPALISGACASAAYYYPLASHEMYLIGVFNLVSLAWLINAVAAFRILSARGMNLPILTLALRTFHSVPKVLVSFVAVVGIFVLCLWHPYLLALFICFLWAPFFVAGEAFAKTIPEPEDSEEDLLFDESEEASQQEIEERYFSNHHIWQIGLGRSFVFGVSNVVTTLEVIALLWFAAVAPAAFVRFVWNNPLSFPVFVLETVLPVFAIGAVLMIASGALLALLPKGARDEIEISKAGEWETAVSRTAPPRPNLIVFFIALPLAVLASWFAVASERQARMMPAGVRYQSEETRLRGDTLLWRIRVEDPGHQFRWFVPENFRLVAHFPEPGKGSDAAGIQKQEPLAPERFYVLSGEGKYLGESFRPWSGPLMIELRFPLSSAFRRAERFGLHYGSFGLLPSQVNDKELGQPLATTTVESIEVEK